MTEAGKPTGTGVEPPAIESEGLQSAKQLRARYTSLLSDSTERYLFRPDAGGRIWSARESPDRRVRERAWKGQARDRLPHSPALDAARRAWIAASICADDAEAVASSDAAVATATEGARHARLALEEFVTSVLVRLHERRRIQLGLKTIRPWDMGALSSTFGSEPVFSTRGAVLEAAADAVRRSHAVDAGVPLLHHTHEASDAVGDMKISPAINLSAAMPSDAEVLHLLRVSASTYDWADSVEVDPQKLEADTAIPLLVELLVVHGDQGSQELEPALLRLRLRHIERYLVRWVLSAMVDAFDEWSAANPDAQGDSTESDAVWVRLWLRFLPAVDWGGLERYAGLVWQDYLDLLAFPQGVAREIDVWHWWMGGSVPFQATDVATLAGTLALYRPTLEDADVLDVARWMEDSMDAIERAYI